MLAYDDFLQSKTLVVKPTGITVSPSDVNPTLFEFQRDIVVWACKKGRCAIFADAGLGKTFMSVEWARLIGKRCLILAPLSIAKQTVREAAKLGVTVTYVRNQSEANKAASQIVITNYQMLEHFNAFEFEAVILDESSILKNFHGETLKSLNIAFRNTQYKLCLTATPAPNDISEIANHAEFLGIMTRVEMLASFFIHDDAGWRLKGHARNGPFFKWLSTWAIAINKPSNLGYSDAAYRLPELKIEPVFVPTDYIQEDRLFAMPVRGITDRVRVRKGTVDARMEAALNIIAQKPSEQWLVWCGLDAESKAITKSLKAKYNVVEVTGSDSIESKTTNLESFIDGQINILVTKPTIAGFGLNMQSCHNMLFLGFSDSFETYYQCVRRCYRFGQQHTVFAYIVLSELEETIYDNVLRKQTEAAKMTDELIAQLQEFELVEIGKASGKLEYKPTLKMILPEWIERI